MIGSDAAAYRQVDTILVIDDDENWCFVAQRLLSKAKACKEIIVANNGLAGLEKLESLAARGAKMPDLIFLDIHMPVLDGFGFLTSLTTCPHLDLSQTRIYICSSSFHAKDKAMASQHGITGFITKPLTKEMLHTIML